MALSFLYLMARRLVAMLLGRLQSEHAKDVEIAVLRHQLDVLHRQMKRPEFRPADRAPLAVLSRAIPRARWSVFLVTPGTILRWHLRLAGKTRAGATGASSENSRSWASWCRRPPSARCCLAMGFGPRRAGCRSPAS